MDKDEVLRSIQVDPDNVVCKTCAHKNYGQEYPHYTKAHCGIYSEGKMTKPMKILFEGADCEYYLKEKADPR